MVLIKFSLRSLLSYIFLLLFPRFAFIYPVPDKFTPTSITSSVYYPVIGHVQISLISIILLGNDISSSLLFNETTASVP